MVKEASRAAVKKDGTQKRRPGKPPKPGEVRTEKLVMRVHPDLMEVLTALAREKGETRSAYVEKLLVGWARLDPRNRRLDMIGKYVPDGPDQKRLSPFAFYERWRQFTTASRLLLGTVPPADWYPSDMDIPDPGDPAVPPVASTSTLINSSLEYSEFRNVRKNDSISIGCRNVMATDVRISVGLHFESRNVFDAGFQSREGGDR